MKANVQNNSRGEEDGNNTMIILLIKLYIEGQYEFLISMDLS